MIATMITTSVLMAQAGAQPPKQYDSFAVFEHWDNIGVWANRYLGLRSAGMTRERALEIAGSDLAHIAIVKDAFTVMPRSTFSDQFARKWVDRCIADPVALGFKP